jgi:hypothetical protein
MKMPKAPPPSDLAVVDRCLSCQAMHGLIRSRRRYAFEKNVMNLRVRFTRSVNPVITQALSGLIKLTIQGLESGQQTASRV